MATAPYVTTTQTCQRPDKREQERQQRLQSHTHTQMQTVSAYLYRQSLDPNRQLEERSHQQVTVYSTELSCSILGMPSVSGKRRCMDGPSAKC